MSHEHDYLRALPSEQLRIMLNEQKMVPADRAIAAYEELIRRGEIVEVGRGHNKSLGGNFLIVAPKEDA